MLKILLKFKNAEIKTLETDKAEITIGRHPGNDIHIDNLGVSKQHAKIIRQDGGHVVEDLNSTNGTFINDKRVARAVLKNNDEVHIGKHSLHIQFKTAGIKASAQDFGDKTVILSKR